MGLSLTRLILTLNVLCTYLGRQMGVALTATDRGTTHELGGPGSTGTGRTLTAWTGKYMTSVHVHVAVIATALAVSDPLHYRETYSV